MNSFDMDEFCVVKEARQAQDTIYPTDYEKLKVRIDALEKENERLTNQLLATQSKLLIVDKNYNNVVEAISNLITQRFERLEKNTEKRIQQLINDAEADNAIAVKRARRAEAKKRLEQGFYNFEDSNEEEGKISPYDFTEPANDGESNDDTYF